VNLVEGIVVACWYVEYTKVLLLKCFFTHIPVRFLSMVARVLFFNIKPHRAVSNSDRCQTPYVKTPEVCVPT